VERLDVVFISPAITFAEKVVGLLQLRRGFFHYCIKEIDVNLFEVGRGYGPHEIPTPVVRFEVVLEAD
jgi:hypothetical protein